MGRRVFAVLLLCLFVIAGAQYSSAQLDTGAIAGTVKDASGAIVPNASVKVTNTKTGRTWTAKSGSIGEFTVPLLPVGPYQIQAEMRGFKNTVISGISLHATETARFDLVLQVGAKTEEVTVTAELARVNTATSDSGATVVANTIQNLPLNGRDFVMLLATVPGSNMTSGFGGNSMDGYATGMDGLNILLDGTDATRVDQNTDNIQMGVGAARVTRASIDSMQEFRILSSAYSAEYGRSVGDVVNVITKSGGNAYHGQLFEYFRNDYMDARNYFYVPESGGAPFRLNQFGGNLAGPIVKNKLFFFTNYEGVRQLVTQAGFASVLNDAMRALAVPAIQPIVDAIPHGNGGPAWSANGIPLGHWFDIYYGNRWTRLREDTASFKLDYTPTEKDTVAFRYNIGDSQTLNKYGFAVGQVQQAPARTQFGKLSWTHIFSPTFINEAGLAVDRARTDSLAGGGDFATVGFNCFFCKVGLGVMPGPNMLSIRSPNTSIQLLDSITKVAGRHTIKFGTDIKRNMVNRELEPIWTVTFNGGPSYTDPITGERCINDGAGPCGPEAMLQNSGIGYSRQGYGMTGVWNTNLAWFFNDDIRVTRRFTLNLGLRYDYNTIIHDPTGKMVNFDLNTMSFTQTGQALYNSDKNDFAPRVGFAWDIFGNGKTALRGGFGIFYLPVENNYLLNQAVNINQNLSVNLFNLWFGGWQCDQQLNWTYPPPATFPHCTNGDGSPLPVTAYYFDKNIRDSYSQHWSFGIQQEVAKNTVLEVQYVGNHGLRMPSYYDLNAMNTTTNHRRLGDLWGSINFQGNFAANVYNALQASLRHYVGQGLNLNANYTWAHEKDDMLGLFETYQNPFDLTHEWASGNTDVRHLFSGSVVYDIPSIRRILTGMPSKLADGWQVTTFVQTRTGLPFTVYANQSSAFSTPLRPDCVPGVSITPDNYSAPRNQLNPDAFAAPAGTFGTCPRNVARGPGFFQADLAVGKNTKFGERLTWQFRGEIFNVFNHPNFGNPGSTMGQLNFGMSGSTIGNLVGVGTSRQIQLTMKLLF